MTDVKQNEKIDEEYRRGIVRWRNEREASLRAPDGWLSLAGLFMLEEGTYTLGSASDNRIVLPSSAPAHLGTLDYAAGRATLHVTADTPVQVDGTSTHRVEMVDNEADNRAGTRPTVVRTATVSFNLHKFGDFVALRIRDSTLPTIHAFPGCRWYEVKPEYCVTGELARQAMPTPLDVTTSVQTTAQYASVGAVTFELLGQRNTLLASAAMNPRELFIILRDATAGRTTYGTGRYLYAPVDEDGMVTLDFNKAYNPPCAFTPFATCSLPPVQNRLAVAIEAGELY